MERAEGDRLTRLFHAECAANPVNAIGMAEKKPPEKGGLW